MDLRHVLTLPAPASLHGRVVLPGRGSFQGFTVILVGKERLAATTGGDGGFGFVQLVPGQYRLRAGIPGYLPIEGFVNLGAGDVRTVGDGVLIPGDVDGSGTVDGRDLRLASRALRRGAASNGADLDDDGDVDVSDLTMVAQSFGLVGPAEWPNLAA